MSEDENKISYHRLSEEALDLLEGNKEQRRLFLDFLSILEDVLAGKAIKLEPPVFTPDEQEEKALELTQSLAADAGLRDAAVANRAAVFKKDAKGKEDEIGMGHRGPSESFH
jgi:hypothetical protein